MQISIIGLLAATMLVGATALAGQENRVPVSVDPVTMNARGDMWSARTDVDQDVYIGCSISTYADGAGGAFRTGWCQAEDADGDFARCETDSGEMLDAIHAIDSYSYISFTRDASDQCVHITVSTQSFYLPELKAK